MCGFTAAAFGEAATAWHACGLSSTAAAGASLRPGVPRVLWVLRVPGASTRSDGGGLACVSGQAQRSRCNKIKDGSQHT